MDRKSLNKIKAMVMASVIDALGTLFYQKTEVLIEVKNVKHETLPAIESTIRIVDDKGKELLKLSKRIVLDNNNPINVWDAIGLMAKRGGMSLREHLLDEGVKALKESKKNE